MRKLGCGAAADHHAQPGVREAAVAAAVGKPAASEESVGFSIPGGRRVSVGQSGDMAKSPKKKSGTSRSSTSKVYDKFKGLPTFWNIVLL